MSAPRDSSWLPMTPRDSSWLLVEKTTIQNAVVTLPQCGDTLPKVHLAQNKAVMGPWRARAHNTHQPFQSGRTKPPVLSKTDGFEQCWEVRAARSPNRYIQYKSKHLLIIFTLWVRNEQKYLFFFMEVKFLEKGIVKVDLRMKFVVV